MPDVIRLKFTYRNNLTRRSVASKANPYCPPGTEPSATAMVPARSALVVVLALTGTLYVCWALAIALSNSLYYAGGSIPSELINNSWILIPGVAGIVFAIFNRRCLRRRLPILAWAFASAIPLFGIGWGTTRIAYTNGWLTLSRLKPGFEESSCAFWGAYFATLLILLIIACVLTLGFDRHADTDG